MHTVYLSPFIWQNIILFFRIITEVYSCCIFAFMTYFCHIYGLFNGRSLVRNAMPNYDIVLMGKCDCFMTEFPGMDCAQRQRIIVLWKEQFLRVSVWVCVCVCVCVCWSHIRHLVYPRHITRHSLPPLSLGKDTQIPLRTLSSMHTDLAMQRRRLYVIVHRYITHQKNKNHLASQIHSPIEDIRTSQ